MLRHLHAHRSALALLGACVTLACSTAPPVEVGVDYVTPPLSDRDAPSEPEVPPLEDAIAKGDDDTRFNYDFIDSGEERGEVSPYCRTSFQACGGLLAGTWVVEDNCNPRITSRDVLLGWGKAQMQLDDAACWDAVQQLRWKWSGELRFEGGMAIDNRQRKQQVDMQLTSRCLSATFGLDRTDSVSPEVCAALEDDATTCGLADGVCLCSNRTVSTGTASGTYGVLGLSVAIGEDPTLRFEYCVDGDMLLWREKEGAQRQVVLRRTAAAPPGETDPVEVPR
jgi:hypothetical protein